MYERMELTTSMLCRAGSSLEFLRANWLLRCGQFDQTAFRDVIGEDTRATDVARDDGTKSSLSMFAGMWGEGGRGRGYAPRAVRASPVDLHREADHRGGVLQPLDGKPQADSQLGGGAARREVNERHVMGQRGQLRQRERQKTRHICETSAVSCSNCAVVKCMEIAFTGCCIT